MYHEIIIYLVFSFILLYIFARISYSLDLVDKPSSRKIHTKATAFTGGIAISSTLIFSILLFDISTNILNLILSMAFLICIVGLIDDKFELSVGSKLSLQIIPIFYLIIFQNLSLDNLGDYNYFKLELGTFAIPFTLLCVLFLINSFNYFDGIDGALSITSITTLSFLYFLVNNYEFDLFLLIILIPVTVFLFFNFSILKLPKMFLGDSGSLLLGFIISFILIYLAKEKLSHPILLAWSISIFVYEFLSINFIRLKNNRNPFIAGKDHLHHLFFKFSNSILITNLFIVIIHITLFLIGYISFILMNSLVSIILFVFLFIVFFILRNRYS